MGCGPQVFQHNKQLTSHILYRPATLIFVFIRTGVVVGVGGGSYSYEVTTD